MLNFNILHNFQETTILYNYQEIKLYRDIIHLCLWQQKLYLLKTLKNNTKFKLVLKKRKTFYKTDILENI